MEPTDAQLELALRKSEPAIGDDGFSETLMSGLPRRHISRTAARRLTLGGAAAAGSVLTSVLGAPLETAFSTFVLEGGVGMATLAGIVILCSLAVPVAWVFYSR